MLKRLIPALLLSALSTIAFAQFAPPYDVVGMYTGKGNLIATDLTASKPPKKGVPVTLFLQIFPDGNNMLTVVYKSGASFQGNGTGSYGPTNALVRIEGNAGYVNSGNLVISGKKKKSVGVDLTSVNTATFQAGESRIFAKKLKKVY